jgi:hypothetical protein
MECLHAWIDGQKNPPPPDGGPACAPQNPIATPGLLLPGAFFMAVGAQLFAPFMFINFAFATFF